MHRGDPMDGLINQEMIFDFIGQRVDEFLKNHKPLPRTSKLTKEVRDDLFHGKSAEWIRLFIFDAYPETNEANGGWVLNPRKTATGKTTTILVKPAIKWLDEHEYEIDWNARVPR